jgi:hypothetical protein
MAVIKCTMKDGKLEVLHVIEFTPGDQIEFDKGVKLIGPHDEMCLRVVNPFRPGHELHHSSVVPCPGNKPIE